MISMTFRPSSGTVLIVEDDRPVARLVREILELEGLPALTAASESEAVAIAAAFTGPIAFLLADVELRQGSGPGTAARLAESLPGLRCAFMSGHDRNELISQGLLDPDAIFLSKPFDLVRFRAVFRDLVETPILP